MKKEYNNKKGISIVIWIWVVAIILLTAYVILDFIVPFMRSTNWVENTSIAYYEAYSWVEDAMININNRTNLSDEPLGSSDSWNSKSYNYNTLAKWWVIPRSWYWNSEFNTDYNRISQSDPIQLEVWGNILTDWNNIKFYFRVPDNDDQTKKLESQESQSRKVDANWNVIFDTYPTPIIIWSLSSSDKTLNTQDMNIATWNHIDSNLITANKINNWSSWFDIWFRYWVIYGWTVVAWKPVDDEKRFDAFYSENCWSSKSCILRIMVVNNVKLNDSKNTPLPYLEYKLDFWDNTVPDRYTIVETSGRSQDFKRNLEIRIPQQTITEALDFTVIQ